jgi:branched-chain amino acid transport system substrate-binding protein
VVAINTVSTPLGKMLEKLTRKENVVILCPGDGQWQAKLGNFHTWGPCYQDAFAATLDWIKKDWSAKGMTGAPKVAILSWDSPYGREPLNGGKEYAAKIGIEMLPSELFPVGSLKHDVYLNRLDQAGANYVYVGGVDPVQTNVMRDAFALGLTKKIQFISDYWGPTSLGISLHPEALEGMVVVSFFLRGEEAQSVPLTKEIWSTYQTNPINTMNGAYGFGLCWGINIEEALRDTIKRVGKDKISRNEIFTSFHNLTGNSRNGVTGEVAYSPQSRRGTKVVKFYKATGGKIVPITDWIETPDAVSLHQWE